MIQKTVYAFNRDTRIYIAPIYLNEHDLSPMEEGVFLIPADCLEVGPPPIPTDHLARAVNGEWVIEEIPLPYQAPVLPPEQLPAPIPIDPASFLSLPLPKMESPQDEKSRLMNSVQSYMDTLAQGYGYDSIATAVTYAEEASVPKFQAEGKAFRAWRSRVWARCYELLEDVQSGMRSVPDVNQLIALLPLFDPQQEQQG